MKNEKKQNYYIELHATGFKYANKFSGFDSCCAHFSSDAKPATPEFVKDMQKAIDLYGRQQVAHGWVNYAIGKLFAQTGSEDVSILCPSYSEGHRSRPAFKVCE